MQYNLYKIKQETYLVMYSDRVRRRYFQGRHWTEGPYAAWKPYYINKNYELLYNRHLELF